MEPLVPLSFLVEFEVGAFLLTVVGGVYTWMHNKHQKALHRQRERHQLAVMRLRERHHREKIDALSHRERISTAERGEAKEMISQFLIAVEADQA